jgi:hypothetical protein
VLEVNALQSPPKSLLFEFEFCKLNREQNIPQVPREAVLAWFISHHLITLKPLWNRFSPSTLPSKLAPRLLPQHIHDSEEAELGMGRH